MGTLFDQPPRDYCAVGMQEVKDFLNIVQELARAHHVSTREVIAAFDVLERRRENDLRTANGDAFDEQVIGLGTILNRLVAAIGQC